MSERYARRARHDAIQYALDRAAACQTLHRFHPGEGWDCAAAEFTHLAQVLRAAPARPPVPPDYQEAQHGHDDDPP